MSSPVNRSGKRKINYILVVDNNSNDLFIASMLLQRFHYQVCTASTAGQALAMVSVAVPSLVIVDLNLPGMSGMDLLGMIKQDPRTSFVPVLLMYEHQNDIAMRRCQSSEASGSIPKPIAVEELYRLVQLSIESTPRAHIRIDTSMVVTVNKELLDQVVGDCASVLSEHGMYIRMKTPYPRNTQLSIQANLNGRMISAEVTVLYSHSFGEGPYQESGMGVQFITITPEDRKYIRHFIRGEVTRGIVDRAAY